MPLCQGRKCYECDYFLLLWYELRCGKVSHLKHIHSKQVRAMNLSHIEHLGIAVKSIEESLPYYEGVLGLKCYNIEEVADQKVKTAFLRVGHSIRYVVRLRSLPSSSMSVTCTSVRH